MAGGALKYRHLGRKSSHRQALLRNLVTSLIEHESIATTWPKAKEAQRMAEKLITLGKRNTEKSRRTAEGMLFSPLAHLPKIFTTLRQRYLNRPGGYTRVLRIEPLNRNNDQAPSAILQLVDGPKDMRFAMTAKTIMRERAADDEPPKPNHTPPRRDAPLGAIRDFTAMNIRKVTRFRPDGLDALEREIAHLESLASWKEKEEKKKTEREKREREEREMSKGREREKREREEREMSEGREREEREREEREMSEGREKGKLEERNEDRGDKGLGIEGEGLGRGGDGFGKATGRRIKSGLKRWF